MGNRALIETEKEDLSVYLHWNGGLDSIGPFLAYCKSTGTPSPEVDSRGWIRLCQTIGNWMGGSVGLVGGESRPIADDNGSYVIRNWDIVGRKYPYLGFKEQEEYDFDEMYLSIKDSQVPITQASSQPSPIGGYVLTSDDCPYALTIGIGLDDSEQFLSSLLEYCNLRSFRSPDCDYEYGWASFCQVIGNIADSTPLIQARIVPASEIPEQDRLLVIGTSWQPTNTGLPAPDNETIKTIDSLQPAERQLGDRYLSADLVPVEDLRVGDRVMCECVGGIEEHTVVGRNERGAFVDLYAHDGEAVPYSWNPNNYLSHGKARRVSESPLGIGAIQTAAAKASSTLDMGESKDDKPTDRNPR